ncbi:fungal-specific transcription factor domain-containing protein [Amylostereum chailletii]|nr:fungal-specific transcription factor domain-containing protein [Amylostereum chailletii]
MVLHPIQSNHIRPRPSPYPHIQLFMSYHQPPVTSSSSKTTHKSISHSPPVPGTLAPDSATDPNIPKGGCWTCRLRRKKCDEQREEGGSCHTCRRLQLNCLGWGARRPDWMRDKDAVQRYKSEIKAHLLRLGLIRGQPRASFIPTASSSSLTPTRSRPTSSSTSYARHDLAGGYEFPTVPSQMDWSYNVPGSSVMSELSQGTASSSVFPVASGVPTPSLNEEGVATLMGSSSSHTHAHTYSQAQSQQNYFGYPAASPSTSPAQRASSGIDDEARRQHIFYYFSDVHGLNFTFSCKMALSACWTILVKEPEGPLQSVLCAISELHSSTVVASDSPNASSVVYRENPVSRFYYDEALSRLEQARHDGPLSTGHALAALHMITYCLATTGGTTQGGRGTTRWMRLLEIACDWVTQTGLLMDENPRLALHNRSVEHALAVKLTMCMDISLAVVLQQSPRMLDLWRRILGGGYMSPRENNAYEVDLYILHLTGCTDAVLLAYAEIAALEHWKATGERAGTLNLRELFVRSATIDQALREYTDPSFPDPPSGRTNAQVMAMAGGLTGEPNADEGACRKIISRIWYETALLYLSSVADVAGGPEVGNATGRISQLLGMLPTTGLDRALLLPLAIVTTMIEPGAHRDMVRSRLGKIDRWSMNVRQLEGALVEMWQRQGTAEGWTRGRASFLERGLTFLLL